MNKIILVLFVVLTFSVVFAGCETTLDKLERMDISYTVLPNGNADMTVVLVANYSKDCLLQRFIEGTDQNLDTVEVTITSTELECPSEFLEDYIDTELGNFDAPLTCATTFVGDDNHIRMNFTGTAIQFAKKSNNKHSISMGGGYFFSNAPDDSSVTINVPAGATIANHLPKGGEKTEARLYWYPAPAQMIQVEYALDVPESINVTENDLQSMVPIMVGAFIGAIVLVLLVLAKIMRAPTPVSVSKAPKKDIESEGKELKAKMKSLENAYLKGSVDETTYRRLMEQYQLQMNDLRVQLKKRNK